jgi:hypothetical protein
VYLCNLLGEYALLVVMIVLGEHQLRVLEDNLGIGSIVRTNAVLIGELSHGPEGLLNLGLQLRPLRCVLGLLEDGLDGAHVVLVEVEGEERIGGGEVVPRRLKWPVLADYLHPIYWVNYISYWSLIKGS